MVVDDVFEGFCIVVAPWARGCLVCFFAAVVWAVNTRVAVVLYDEATAERSPPVQTLCLYLYPRLWF